MPVGLKIDLTFLGGLSTMLALSHILSSALALQSLYVTLTFLSLALLLVLRHCIAGPLRHSFLSVLLRCLQAGIRSSCVYIPHTLHVVRAYPHLHFIRLCHSFRLFSDLTLVAFHYVSLGCALLIDCTYYPLYIYM